MARAVLSCYQDEGRVSIMRKALCPSRKRSYPKQPCCEFLTIPTITVCMILACWVLQLTFPLSLSVSLHSCGKQPKSGNFTSSWHDLTINPNSGSEILRELDEILRHSRNTNSRGDGPTSKSAGHLAVTGAELEGAGGAGAGGGGRKV